MCRLPGGAACRGNPMIQPLSTRRVRARLVSQSLLSAALLLTACAPPPPPPAAPQEVLATPVGGAADGADQRYPGEVRARFESTLGFRIDGKIVARHAHLGDLVHRGDVLAELDPADVLASRAAAAAGLDAARQRLALAQQQHDRNARQGQEDLVSRAEIEQTDTNLALAQAELEQRTQELALASHQAQYAALVVDHDGTITSESAEVGTVVRAGQAVYGLAWSGERDVVIDVPETRIGTLRRGQPARVALAATPGSSLSARVREVADAADPQTRTYRVRLALASPAAARPGMSAEVALAPPARTAQLVIPASALFHDGEQPAVWLIGAADHRLALRRVQVERYDTDTVRLASGLAAGDWIVERGVHTVSAGQVVQPVAAGRDGVLP